jgi:hypothetical protein
MDAAARARAIGATVNHLMDVVKDNTYPQSVEELHDNLDSLLVNATTTRDPQAQYNVLATAAADVIALMEVLDLKGGVRR